MEILEFDQCARRLYDRRPDDAYTYDEVIEGFRRLKCQFVSYDEGELCIGANEPIQKMLYVLSGTLHTRMRCDNGEDVVMCAIRENQYYGASFIFNTIPTFPHEIVAFTKAEVAYFDIEAIRSWRGDPKSRPLFDLIAQELCNELIETRRKAMILSGATISERLLRYLSVRMQVENTRTIRVPGAQYDLASYLGVNTSALSRSISRLIEKGFIKHHRNEFTVLERISPQET